MNLSMRQLRAFVAVAKLGSFTRAAQQVHMTQAGLSLMLREMEAQIDCRLFHRTTRAVWLTEGGERFLPTVERVLRELDEATELLGKLSESGRHRMTVAATPLLSASVMPAVCKAFNHSHPEVDVFVRDAERSLIQPMVDAGSVDVGLGILFKPAAGVRRKTLFATGLVHVSAFDAESGSKRAMRRDAPVTWASLRREPLIGLPPDNGIQQFIDARLNEIGRADAVHRTFANLHTLIAMVEAGYGSAILPSFVREACSRYRVRVCGMAKPQVTLDFYAITKSGLAQPAALTPFLKTFSEWMGQRALT